MESPASSYTLPTPLSVVIPSTVNITGDGIDGPVSVLNDATGMISFLYSFSINGVDTILNVSKAGTMSILTSDGLVIWDDQACTSLPANVPVNMIFQQPRSTRY
jgi:hypothetical protein